MRCVSIKSYEIHQSPPPPPHVKLLVILPIRFRPPPHPLREGRQVEKIWTRKLPPPPNWDRRAIQPNLGHAALLRRSAELTRGFYLGRPPDQGAGLGSVRALEAETARSLLPPPSSSCSLCRPLLNQRKVMDTGQVTRKHKLNLYHTVPYWTCLLLELLESFTLCFPVVTLYFQLNESAQPSIMFYIAVLSSTIFCKIKTTFLCVITAALSSTIFAK